MLRLTLRNLNAFKIRLALTTFAVVLGVSFVVSSFVLTDGFRESFSSLSSDIVSDVDFEVQPTSEFGTPEPFSDEVVSTVAAIDGVETALGLVTSESIYPIAADGEVLTGNGPPLISTAWVDDAALSQFSIVDGRAPEGQEFTMESNAAEANDFEIGTTYDLATPTGTQSLTLVGTTSFADGAATMGAVLMQMPAGTLSEIIDRVGLVDGVAVSVAPDATMDDVRSSLEAAFPVDVDILDNAELIADTQSDFDQSIDIINNVMLGFAVVALFVSIFIIANTFAIVVGQRTAQLALLRAIGATPSQVRRSTMGEALIIGVLASLIGLVGGLGITIGLQALFEALGADFPDAPLVLQTRTVIIALVVGIGVTLLSAMGPARKAATVSPMQAMQASVEAPAPTSRRRSLFGLAALALGVALGCFGLFTNPGSTSATVALLGFGAFFVFAAMTLMAPVLVRPIVTVLGLPLRSLGAAGRLSTQNAGRNPRRTASTAASLTIGLGLVTTALVVGQSVKIGLVDLVSDTMNADVVLDSDNDISAAQIDILESSGVFDVIGAYRYDEAMVDGEVEMVIGVDLVDADALYDVSVTEGALTGEANSMAIYRPAAEEAGLSVGDTVEVGFPLGGAEAYTVRAIFDSNSILDLDYVISDNDWKERFGTEDFVWAAATFAEGVDSTDSLDMPGITFQDQESIEALVSDGIDQMLVVVNVMLALAVIIALLGIANTAALSVFERTREVGLLRAVGMSRRQTRQMFRWESAQVSILGALLGIAIGLLFGAGVVAALPDFLAASLSIPVTRILILLAVCGACGLIAAALPARRASRLDVIEALAM